VANEILTIQVIGLDKVIAAFGRFPNQIGRYMGLAGIQAGQKIIQTKGLAQYPPATAANVPPTPYYIRGRGTQTAHGNLGNSQNYGKSYTVEGVPYGVRIGNSASYAKYLGGEEQVHWAGPRGWRKVFDVAKEKLDIIRQVYNDWIAKCIRDLGL